MLKTLDVFSYGLKQLLDRVDETERVLVFGANDDLLIISPVLTAKLLKLPDMLNMKMHTHAWRDAETLLSAEGQALLHLIKRPSMATAMRQRDGLITSVLEEAFDELKANGGELSRWSYSLAFRLFEVVILGEERPGFSERFRSLYGSRPQPLGLLAELGVVELPGPTVGHDESEIAEGLLQLAGRRFGAHHSEASLKAMIALAAACCYSLGLIFIESLYFGFRCPQLADSHRNPAMRKQFAREVMRAGPTAWALPHLVQRDFDLDGINFRSGQHLLISPLVMHYHPEAWTRPDLFDPGRFGEPYPKEAFIPFGLGARKCPATRISEHLVDRFLACCDPELFKGLRLDGELRLQPWVSIRPEAPLHVRPVVQRSADL